MKEACTNYKKFNKSYNSQNAVIYFLFVIQISTSDHFKGHEISFDFSEYKIVKISNKAERSKF